MKKPDADTHGIGSEYGVKPGKTGYALRGDINIFNAQHELVSQKHFSNYAGGLYQFENTVRF